MLPTKRIPLRRTGDQLGLNRTSACRFYGSDACARGLFLGERARRDHFGLDRRTGETHHVGLHREVLRQTESIHALRGASVPLLDSLPELAVLLPRKRRAILLTLMLEDRHLLRPQLVFGERDKHVGLGDLPLLPRAAIVPHLGRPTRVFGERALNGFETHPVSAVRVREITRDEYQLRLLFLEQLENDADILRANGILLHLPGLIEGQVEEARLLALHPERLDAGDRLGFADRALHHLHWKGVDLSHLLRVEALFHLLDQCPRGGT